MQSRFKLVLALTALMVIPACGSPLSLLTGGGPNVAANTQAGQENSQTIGADLDQSQNIVRPNARDITQTKDTNTVRTEKVESLTIQETPLWIIVLLILGWLLPSPGEMGRILRGFFKK